MERFRIGRTGCRARRRPGAARVLLLLAALAGTAVDAATLHVPLGYPTIQAAINAAQNGDTVLVAPGTFVENISFVGKAITVRSAAGPQATTIDGGLADVVVKFISGETTSSVLADFTLTRGQGGAVQVGYQSSATTREGY